MNTYDTPKAQEFQLEGVEHISVELAYKLISNDEIFFIDVREKSEHQKEYFDFNNVFLYPLSTIMDNIHLIPQGIFLVIVCNEGIRSTKVANLLNRQGYSSVANLDGGIFEWRKQEFPIATVSNVSNYVDSCSSGGCGCNCEDC